jgi:hypothetical protein
MAWLQFFASVKPAVPRKRPVKIRKCISEDVADASISSKHTSCSAAENDSKPLTVEPGKAKECRGSKKVSRTKLVTSCGQHAERRVNERSRRTQQKNSGGNKQISDVVDCDPIPAVDSQVVKCHSFSRNVKPSCQKDTDAHYSQINKKTVPTDARVRRRTHRDDVISGHLELGIADGKRQDTDDTSNRHSRIEANIAVESIVGCQRTEQSKKSFKHCRRRTNITEDSSDRAPKRRRRDKTERKSKTWSASDDELIDTEFGKNLGHKKSSKHGDTSRSKHTQRPSNDGGDLSTAEKLWSSMIASDNQVQPGGKTPASKTSAAVSVETPGLVKPSNAAPTLKSFMDAPLFDDDDDFPQLVIDVSTV